MTISLRRESDRVYWNANLADGSTSNVEQNTDIINIYSCIGDVYVGLAYGNVSATITDLVIVDGGGNTVFDLATGTLEEVIGK